MDELISRQAAIKKILFCENHDMEHDFEFNEGLIAATNAVSELPTAEKKGRWIEERGIAYCSVCGKTPDIWCSFDESEWNYCPLCGARMEE